MFSHRDRILYNVPMVFLRLLLPMTPPVKNVSYPPYRRIVSPV